MEPAGETKTSAQTTTLVSEVRRKVMSSSSPAAASDTKTDQQASLVQSQSQLPNHLWLRSVLWLTIREQVVSVRGVSSSFRECSDAYMEKFWLRPMVCVPQDASSLTRAMEMCLHLRRQEEYVEGRMVVVKVGSGVHEVEGSCQVPWDEKTYEKMLSVPCDKLSFVGQGEGKTTVHGGLVVENGRKIRIEHLTVKSPSGHGLVASGTGVEMILRGVTVGKCQDTGVWVEEGTKFDAMGCQFYQNGQSGVRVDGSTTTARFTNCTSHHNKGDGVWVTDGAVVDLIGEETSVHDNLNGLAACYDGSTINVYHPCVLDGMSHGNKNHNVYRYDGGTVRQKD